MDKDTKILIVASFAFMICNVLFFVLGQTLEKQGFGIVDQQFAWSQARTSEIFETWKPVMDSVYLFMLVDMVYPLTYAMILIVLHRKLGEGKFAIVGIRSAVVASVCDYLENVLTFAMLLSGFIGIIPFFVGLFATIKFLGILSSIVLLVYRKLVSDGKQSIE